jgi:NAD(P)-dependent dehydrogenase (short-subunit alcohol dehydrogenase family)
MSGKTILITGATDGLGRGVAGALAGQGYELNFAVNYLSQFLLITRLLHRLRASAPARIVLVSSLVQALVDFDDVMLETGDRRPVKRGHRAGAVHLCVHGPRPR